MRKFIRDIKRCLAFFVAISMIISLMPYNIIEAKAAPKLSKSKITIYMDKPVTLTVKNTNKKVSFSSSKKSVVSVKKVSKNKVKLVPKNTGKATVTAKVSGKNLKCMVTVRHKNYKMINASIDGRDFLIQLYDNKSARAFYDKLPMTITMNELNGNEKYYDMSEELPSKDRAVKKIKNGDFMLYGSDCLVLFYKSFSTSYSYTPLGKIKDLAGYKKAMKKDKVKVVFSKFKHVSQSTEVPVTTEEATTIEAPTATEAPATTEAPAATETPATASRIIHIKAGDEVMEAVLENNSSADEFLNLLEKGPVTIDMHDYGNFEKVGSLGESITRNDVSITTSPGDIILYQGNQVTIYYDVNTWSFTKLGHITGATKEKLKAVLGDGNVSVTFYR